MEAGAAQRQIEDMKSIIMGEASDQVRGITTKGEEEFQIEVQRLIKEQKEKVQAGYQRKVKEIETQYAITKSLAINKQRLEKIKKRQEMMTSIANDAKEEVMAALKDQAKSKGFIQQLVVQGLLMLLEPEVAVRCRECDVSLVESCLDGAAKQYSEVIKEKTGATKTCKLVINKKDFLEPPPVAGQDKRSCLGGVVLSCFGGKIKIDNTIDARLALVMEQDKPAIRKLLFPTA